MKYNDNVRRIAGVFAWVVALMQFACPASAQKLWTLRECIDYAVKNNIEIHQREITVENSEIELNTSRQRRLPNLNANASQNFNFGRSPSMSTGIYEATSSAGTGFGISSSVPVFQGFGITSDVNVKKLNLLAATEGLAKAKDNLALTVASYYLDVLYRKELLNVTQEQLTYDRGQERRTAALIESGKVPASQMFDLNAQLARDELNVTNAANDLAVSLLNLTQALNITDSEDFDIKIPETDAINPESVVLAHPETIYNTAITIKPHVREARYLLESSEQSIKLAKSSFWPSISLGGSYNTGFDHSFNEAIRNAGVKNQLSNNQREAIGLSLSIPLFNRNQTRNQVRSSRLNMESYVLNLESVKQGIFKEIQQAYLNAEAARAKIVSTDRAVRALEESYRAADMRYSVGKGTIFELGEIANKLLQSRSEHLQAKYELIFRAKIIDFYLGKEIAF